MHSMPRSLPSSARNWIRRSSGVTKTRRTVPHDSDARRASPPRSTRSRTEPPMPTDPYTPAYLTEHPTVDRTLRGSLDVLPDGERYVTISAESRRSAGPYVCLDISDAPLAHLDALLGVLAGLRAAVAADMAQTT